MIPTPFSLFIMVIVKKSLPSIQIETSLFWSKPVSFMLTPWQHEKAHKFSLYNFAHAIEDINQIIS